MSAPTFTAMREALAAALGTVSGVRAYSHFPEKVNTPAAIVGGPSATYNDSTMTDEYTIPVLVLVADSSDRTAQLNLDSYLNPTGSTSIRAAIENDPKLGGVVETLYVTALHDYGVHELNAIRYMGAMLDVVVIVDRWT